jgi:hypothetical protein
MLGRSPYAKVVNFAHQNFPFSQWNTSDDGALETGRTPHVSHDATEREMPMSISWLKDIGDSPSEQINALELTLMSRRNDISADVRYGKRITLLAIVSAVVVPIATWSVLLFFIENEKSNQIATFAFSAIPLSAIFVAIAIIMHRRRRNLEEQLDRLDDALLSIRKLQILSQLKCSQDALNAFREVVLIKALAGRSSLRSLGKEEDEMASALGVIESLIKITADSRPKGPSGNS